MTFVGRWDHGPLFVFQLFDVITDRVGIREASFAGGEGAFQVSLPMVANSKPIEINMCVIFSGDCGDGVYAFG